MKESPNQAANYIIFSFRWKCHFWYGNVLGKKLQFLSIKEKFNAQDWIQGSFQDKKTKNDSLESIPRFKILEDQISDEVR